MKRAFPNLLFFAVPYISRKEKTPEQTEEGEETVITKTESKPGKAKELEDGSTQTAKKAIEDAGDKPETSASETMESTSEAASAETVESTSEAAIAKTKAGTPKKAKPTQGSLQKTKALMTLSFKNSRRESELSKPCDRSGRTTLVHPVSSQRLRNPLPTNLA